MGGATSTGSRRRRLWELPTAAHELLLGLSMTPDEWRATTQQALSRLHRATVRLDGSDAAVLSSTACDLAARNGLSEALQALLDRRHAATVRAASQAKDIDSLRARWVQALDPGAQAADLPGWLWSVLTHPLGEPQQDVVLSEARCWMFARLREQMAAARRQADIHQAHERLKTRWALAQAAAVRARSAEQQRRGADAAAMARLRGELARMQERERSSAQDTAASSLPSEAPAQVTPTLGSSNADDPVALSSDAKPRQRLHASGNASSVRHVTPLAPLRRDTPDEAPAPRAALAIQGRNVLCVGGVQRAVGRYRSLVEANGGRFAHHDGGIEDSLQRLPSQLAAADVVLCQAGCLNHEAYRRVKAHCKRAGTPCVFLDRPSLNRLAGVVSRIADA